MIEGLTLNIYGFIGLEVVMVGPYTDIYPRLI